MKKNYGEFLLEPGCYKLTSLPDQGNFEYLYKSKYAFLRVDQYGISSLRLDPPSGMTLIQRGNREPGSPWRVYFSYKGHIYNNFDVTQAKKFEIVYRPECAVYTLDFGGLIVTTTLSISATKADVIMEVSYQSTNGKALSGNYLAVADLDPVDTSMAVWDKTEWYMSTVTETVKDKQCFLVSHSSVNGTPAERRYACVLGSSSPIAATHNRDYLFAATKGFTRLSFESRAEKMLVGYPQTAASLSVFPNELSFQETYALLVTKEKPTNYDELFAIAEEKAIEQEKTNAKNAYLSLLDKRNVKTKNPNFDAFINGFLPLELDWVSILDRGWPTGMRGTRDSSNDLMGYLAYDPAKARQVLVELLSAQRKEDGWFPRQVPSGEGTKFDMRPFVDGGCFLLELAYEYLAYTSDFSVLEEEIPYFGKEASGKGIEHIVKAALFYTIEDNIGEHGLIKLKGGDWLDCLNRVGLQGRAETLHVTCQAIYAFKQVTEIASRYGDTYKAEIALMAKRAEQFKKAAKACYNEEGFYNALYADDGNCYFSLKDIDGKKRVYLPSNAYAILAEVDPRHDRKVIEAIEKNNASEYGLKLFSSPFGDPAFDAMGKMSTGDFAQYLFENGSVYNHAVYFYLRGLAKAGDHKHFYRSLASALPFDDKIHPECTTGLARYTCTNAYNLIPACRGRGGLAFLTGSIAMAERVIYNEMFGLHFTLDTLEIRPCLPKQFENAEVTMNYLGKHLTFRYVGFGSKTKEISRNNKVIEGNVIKKEDLHDQDIIEITLA